MRIAVFQSQTGIDPAANRDRLIDAVEQAAAGGAAMLFTPEMSGLLDRDRGRAGPLLRNAAEDIVLAGAREAAARTGLWIHIGSLALAGGTG